MFLEHEKGTPQEVISELEDQIAQIKNKLNSYNQNTLTAYRILIGALREKKENLEKLINDYQTRIYKLPQQETVLAGLTREKNVYEKVFTLLLDKREEMRLKEISQLQDIIVVDKASLPIEPVSPDAKIILLACIIVWGAFTIVYVFVGEYRERKLLKLDEIEFETNLSILSIIPRFSKQTRRKIRKAKVFTDKFALLQKDNLGIVESFRVLQTKLISILRGDSKVIMVTSCEENSGKTTLVANLAISLVKSGKKVLVVDADLKRCVLSDLLGVSRESPGLNKFLSNSMPKPPIVNLNKSFNEHITKGSLNLLPAGDVTEYSSDLFQSEKSAELLGHMKSSFFDYIIIDTPPVTRVVDGLILSKLIDNIVVVVRHEFSFKDSVKWGIEELKSDRDNLLGIVVNACDIAKSSFKHKYGYGYGYKYAYKNNGRSRKDKKKVAIK
jgi:capsular exopolysaccharide synthesis family protein